MPLPSWARYMMQKLTPSELQAGTSFDIPTRITRPRTYTRATAYEIRAVPRDVRGTGIPASTWVKFRSGKWTPGPRTLEKLRPYYQRYVYNRMRSTGISRDEASKGRGLSPKEAARTVEYYRKLVQEISLWRRVDPLFVAWGISLSDRTEQEWDIYISQKYGTVITTDEEDYYKDAN